MLFVNESDLFLAPSSINSKSGSLFNPKGGLDPRAQPLSGVGSWNSRDPESFLKVKIRKALMVMARV